MITNILRILFTRTFRSLMLNDDIDENLKLDSNDIGIYVHIPFCTTLCSFCPYNKIKYDKSKVELYKDALIKEINMIGKLYKTKKSVSSVYFGGGTPALMIDEFGEIISALKNNFNIENNIGIELHPRDIDKQSLVKLKSVGFDMVSIGVQSFEEESLKVLGREYIDGAEKVRVVKNEGFKVIDVDLIFGIQNQSKESLKSDFIKAYKSGATQISTYPFIDFSYANNKSKPLGKIEKKELLNSLEEISSNIGYERTAVWTFAKKHTKRYSSITRDSFIGFGASASSLTKEVFKINTFSVDEYIKCVNKGKIPTALNMKFNKRTRALYWLFWNSYTLKLDNEQFKKIFDVDIEDVFKLELKIGKILGVIRKVDGGYELTKRGTYLYHLIEQKYTNQYIDKTWSTLRENAWPNQVNLY